MKFEEALAAMKVGHEVVHEEWDAHRYGFIAAKKFRQSGAKMWEPDTAQMMSDKWSIRPKMVPEQTELPLGDVEYHKIVAIRDFAVWVNSNTTGHQILSDIQLVVEYAHSLGIELPPNFIHGET